MTPRFSPGDLLFEPDEDITMIDCVICSGSDDDAGWCDTIEAERRTVFLGLGDAYMRDASLIWRSET